LYGKRLRDMVNFALLFGRDFAAKGAWLVAARTVRGSKPRMENIMKQLLTALFLVLSTALGASADTASLSLVPVPYALKLPADIVARLTTTPLTGPFAEESVTAGAVASSGILYEPQAGNKTILMSVYYFPEASFDAAQNPNEPPPFGKAVIREGGMVLSVAGPQDTIFEPETQDGKNVVAASMLIYEPASYASTK